MRKGKKHVWSNLTVSQEWSNLMSASTTSDMGGILVRVELMRNDLSM
jgi:hypothetical protein